jgi:hypothetical protein
MTVAPESTLWLVDGQQPVPLLASAMDGAATLKTIQPGEIVEATRIAPGSPWAQLCAGEATRLLVDDHKLAAGCRAEEGAFLHLASVQAIGGRVRDKEDELWFSRPMLAPMLRQRPARRAPLVPISSMKPMRTMGGRKVEASPPLRALEHSLRDEHVGCLVENGYAVLDDALPLALCRKLKAEMQALEDNDQMWNSQSYSNDDDGKPHHHINETSLDYKQVRKFAPTFARMEHDPSLVERMRGVPGLEQLGNQHVRIQINAGHGGCYTMHTDQGTMYTDSGNSSTGQTLCLTALVYLNEDWQPGDGGELRIFPYPHPPEVIAPLAGRLVLFEPRMVHDVLPNWKKRFCFTLWCSKKDPNQASRQIDHESVTNIELSMALSDGAAIAEAWRKRHGHPIVYGATLPRALRPLFLPEQRMMLVRVVHASDEIAQISQSHNEEHAGSMVNGLIAHHARVRAANPAWLLDMLRQLCQVPEADEEVPGEGVEQGGGTAPTGTDGHGVGEGRVSLSELKACMLRLGPWWI